MSRQWYRIRTTLALGEALATIRREQGWTQDEAAAHAQASRPTISRMERGDSTSTATVLTVASECGYDVVLVPKGARLTVE